MHTDFEQTPKGAITPASSFSLATGRSALAELRVGYRGTGPAYVQLHDAAEGETPDNGSLMGGSGFLVDDGDHVDLFLNWAPGHELVFQRGIMVALSSTQDTYTASAETMLASGQWGGGGG